MAEFQDTWRAGGLGIGAYTLQPRTVGEVPLTIDLLAGQTANGFRVRSSTGAVLFSVDPSGNLTAAGTITVTVNEVVTGNITLSGALTVAGITTLNGAATINNTLTVTGATVFGNNSPTGTGRFLNNLTVDNAFTVSGESTLFGRVYANVIYHGRQTTAPVGLTNRGGVYTFVGDVGTTELWYVDAAGNTVQITDSGALEGSSLFWDDDEYIRMGNTAAAPDVRMGWNTTQTVDAWYFGVADGQNTLLVAENGDRAFDFAHGAQTFPTVFIHSQNQNTAQWISLTHNATDGVINTGTGSVIFQNITLTPAATHSAVQIPITWTAENFQHNALTISATQNGANTNAVRGLNISMTKATAATTLDTMIGILINAPTVTGTVTTSFAIDIADQTNAGITTPRAIRTQAGLANAIVIANSVRLFANGPNSLFIAEDSGAKAIQITVSSGVTQTINTSTTGNDTIALQAQTFTSGASHNAVQINPIWASENFQHNALNISATQNGGNTNAVRALTIDRTKATGATTLDTLIGILISAPTVTGTVTTNFGIDLADQSPVGGTTAFAIRVQSQTANATTTRALELVGTGVSNAIRLGASANLYGQAAETVRITDSTNARGLDIILSTTTQTIRTTDTTTGSILLQTQTFTPGATHSAVQITPVWATENFEHNALAISATQNGANTNALRGLTVSMTKATGATTLGTMIGVLVNAPTVTGTVTTSFALDIADQANGGIATPRGIRTQLGVANAFVIGNSALIFANVGDSILFVDSTAARGLQMIFTAAGNQTINTSEATTSSLLLQNQTFTPAAAHNSVSIQPTYAAENFNHTALSVTGTQNGANTEILTGLNVGMTKATGATTLGTMRGVFVAAATVTGTVTTNFGIDLADQSPVGGTTAFAIRVQSQTANATTTRALELVGTGVNNAIRLGASANMYGQAAETIRITDSTNARGIDLVLSTTTQIIRTTDTTTGALIFQNNTYTAGATHSTVQISPAWAAENFQHNALAISATQNGANTNALRGLTISMTKATGATTLDTMIGLLFNAPTVTGTVTTSFALDIADQANVGITTPRALRTATGVANAFVVGNSALFYANAAENVRLMDSTNARGLDFTLTAAGAQTITTSGGNLNLDASTGVIAVVTARHEYSQGANVASAADITLGADGNMFLITGTTTINTIASTNWQAGSIIILLFSGNLTCSHDTAGAGARMQLDSALAYTTGASTSATRNGMLALMFDGTNWQEVGRKNP